MGLELAAMGVGEGIKAYMANRAAQGVDSATRAGIAQQAASRAQATAAVNGEIGNIASDTPTSYTAGDMNQFMDALRANSGRINATTPAVAGADPRYAAAVKAAQDAATAHTNTNAGYIAQLMGAQQMRQNENFGIQDTGNTVGQIQRVAGQNDFLTQLRAQQESTPNPWVNLGSNLINGAASSGVLQPRTTVNAPADPTQWGTIPAVPNLPSVMPGGNSQFSTGP